MKRKTYEEDAEDASKDDDLSDDFTGDFGLRRKFTDAMLTDLCNAFSVPIIV